MLNNVKERFIGATGSISGLASILGSWQICHNICLGLIALLSVIGITVVGMPLLFLTKLAIPFWIATIILLIITMWFFVKKKCISSRLIMINSGLIIAGIPFQSIQNFSKVFWTIGGILVILGNFLARKR